VAVLATASSANAALPGANGSLAFNSDRDGDFDIYVMDLNGCDLVQVTNDPGNDFNPAWSPDGRLLAFNSDRSGDFEVYVVSAAGGAPRRLTDSPGVDSVVAFSPNGRWLAFESSRTGNADVFLMRPDGSDQRNVTAPQSAQFRSNW
jgi:Tol biopolymer transport system component